MFGVQQEVILALLLISAYTLELRIPVKGHHVSAIRAAGFAVDNTERTTQPTLWRYDGSGKLVKEISLPDGSALSGTDQSGSLCYSRLRSSIVVDGEIVDKWDVGESYLDIHKGKWLLRVGLDHSLLFRGEKVVRFVKELSSRPIVGLSAETGSILEISHRAGHLQIRSFDNSRPVDRKVLFREKVLEVQDGYPFGSVEFIGLHRVLCFVKARTLLRPGWDLYLCQIDKRSARATLVMEFPKHAGSGGSVVATPIYHQISRSGDHVFVNVDQVVYKLRIPKEVETKSEGSVATKAPAASSSPLLEGGGNRRGAKELRGRR
jgi:hypothetical protein